ncbi:hypothetical protein NEMBOFW57_004549 [Staphylotrichum longicolle]|uniref:NACHT domain-containing protein n=1 Tax=Staphylotrichum longicolle TaxID=669026 RepID=A0AAD4F7V3_9PEZI|nr:hypothetical protein NEMBOFW57_004549 [Staphylotrichum longicolle]
MAESSFEVRRAIVSMIEDGVGVSHGDYHMLWNKLFVDRIFKLESLKSQVWVIDAVDECSSTGVPSLVAMLSKLGRTTPIRVFLTSRPGGQLERLLVQERVPLKELSTGQTGSLADIEGFLQAKCPQIRDNESFKAFLTDVLSKSNGIFLWASLIVSRLENIYSVEDMQETLQAIPSEMDGFYSRIADSILASPSSDLARCILKWVICSPRPLTTDELMEAVKLDIDRTLTASSGQLETITGHLIFVDSHSRVHVTHQTTERDSILLSDPKTCTIITLRATDGSREETALLQSSPDSDSSDGEEQLGSWGAAERIRFGVSQKLVALSYRSSLIAIWDLEAVEKIGNFEREGYITPGPPASDMVFNPIPELELLAISYKDGNLVLCNPWTLEQTAQYRLECTFVLMASTSDGRVLAGGAEDGLIHLFLFETLQPLYRVKPPNDIYQLRGLVFSADNLRFFEIREQCCNVWEPLVLVPKDRADDSSSEPQSEEVASQEAGSSSSPHAFQWRQAVAITQATERELFFVGRHDGTIDVCNGHTGDSIKKLRLHRGSARIKHMGWSDVSNILLTVDDNNRTVVTHLAFKGQSKEPDATSVLDYRGPGAVRQALLSPDAASVILRSDSQLRLISINGTSTISEVDMSVSFCTTHPSNPSLLVAVQTERVHLLDWVTLSKLSPDEGIPVAALHASPSQSGMKVNWYSRSGSPYLVRTVGSPEFQTTSFAAFDASKLVADTKEVDLQVRVLHKVHVRAVVGVLKSSLYFLDATGWVCSVGLKNLRLAAHYTRHFFIPPTWYMGGDVVIGMVSKTAVVFARGERLIVFHGFLEFEEKVLLGDGAALTLQPKDG